MNNNIDEKSVQIGHEIIGVGREVLYEPERFIQGISKIKQKQKKDLKRYLDFPETKELEDIDSLSWNIERDPSHLHFNSLMSHSLLCQNYKIENLVEDHHVSEWASRLFALYSAIKMSKPDRIIALTSGAVPLASIVNSWGHDIDKISAHKEKRPSRNYKFLGVKEYPKTKPFNSKEKCLILDDATDGKKPTYRLVKQHLKEHYGLSDDNFNIFILSPPNSNNLLSNLKCFKESQKKYEFLNKDNVYFWDTIAYASNRDSCNNWRIIREFKERDNQDFYQLKKQFLAMLEKSTK
tara:strand:- start:1644 stop:2525 length:882 start_codon:yes stop_codon:yes gene_type:complete